MSSNTNKSKSLVLTVTNNYEVSLFIKTLSPNEVEELLYYGEQLYKEHKNILIHSKDDNKEREKMRQEYKAKLLNEVELMTETFNITKQSIIKEYENNISKLLNKINELTINQFDRVDKERSKLNKEYETRLEHERNQVIKDMESKQDKIHDIYTSQINAIQRQFDLLLASNKERESGLNNLDKIVRYYDFENNTDKGNKGENKIQEILKSFYNNSSIKDTSGKTSMGDFHFSIPSITCLIEVKNKKYIKEEDVNKFVFDINHNKHKVNCGLFISLLSEHIPTKGSFHIEFIHGNMPVIYLYLNDINSIKFSIDTLVFLVSNISNKNDSENNVDIDLQKSIVSLIHKNFTMMNNETSRIDTIINMLEKQIHQLHITKKNIISSIDHVKDFYNNNVGYEYNPPQLDKDTIHGYTQDDIKKLKEWISKNNKAPLRKDIKAILKLSNNDVNKRLDKTNIMLIKKVLRVKK
jgi:hypothetical protein